MTDYEKNIGYIFKSEDLRELALSHSSYVNENKLPQTENNERLEFLGDAVLELVTTDYLYAAYPDLLEGELTKLRASVVCEPKLAKCSRALSLGIFLKMGKGEENTGGRERESILSDMFEATIGGIYLDGGYEPAKEFILKNLESEIKFMRSRFLQYDAKTSLQEILQRNGPAAIEYRVISETGPEHEKIFEVTVSNSGEILGKGEGKNKKEAEQHAAAMALKAFL